jgi:transmembrane sensor
LKKEEAQELLRKYRLGLCTRRESEIIEHWYNSLGRNNNCWAEHGELDKVGAQMLENINKRIDIEEKLRQPPTKDSLSKDPKALWIGQLMKIAAILFILGGMGYFLYDQSADTEPEGEVISSVASTPSTIYLSDGSVVWLKGESQLIYPPDFIGTTREVTLIGEAFFDVAKDPKKSFIIHTSQFTTSVLGTSFNIKAYENDISQEVAVVTGKVLVSVKEDNVTTKEVILQPNQKVVFLQKDKVEIELKEVTRDDYYALAKSKLVFKETSLEDIIKVLNLAHNANISLSNDNMKSCLITADLSKENLGISMEILSKAINAEYTIDGNKIVLSGQGCGGKY